jgi:DNA polymerase I-like protein with 3'-5' exonuclease and polymerase domains
MIAAYETGDPYLAFAKQAEAVPPHATKQSHGATREQFKACALGVLFGMGAQALSLRIGQSESQARDLIRIHQQTYPIFWRWSDAAVDHGMLVGCLYTVFGWFIQLGERITARTLRNFPMQGNGAEMLRLACCLATERGVRVCAPVHDALLIESPLDEIHQTVATVQELMAQASALVLGGPQLRSEATLVLYPDRYCDERGIQMWNTVWELVGELKNHRLNESCGTAATTM